jgi:hypothetical protein
MHLFPMEADGAFGAASMPVSRFVLKELDKQHRTFRRLLKCRQVTAFRQDVKMRMRQCVGERLAHGDRHDLIRLSPKHQRWHP